VSAVEVFQFPATGEQIRTILSRGGVPLFSVADTCRGLQHSNPSVALKLVDEDDRVMVDLRETDSPSLNRTSIEPRMWFVTESGFYTLALASQAPGAKAFRRWITHEVLPAIRQTGRFEVAQLDELEVARRYVIALEAKNAAEQKVAELAPKAEAHEAFESADGTYSFEQVAKMLHGELGLGRNNLIKRLRVAGVLMDSNLPYQRYAHHFHVVASSFEHSDGRRETSYTTRVRATGVDFIRRRLGSGQGVLVPVT
jgi:anti-repressor protein